MGKVIILPETTKNPISFMGEMAGICYDSDVTDQSKNYKRGLNCLNSGHGRVMEFVDVHLVIDGYSARVMREYMRHVGAGLSVLQQSTRYIDYSKGFDYIVPHSISKNGANMYVYKMLMKEINDKAAWFKERGIPQEDIANILPLGMTTKIVDSKNLRCLVDMSHVRMCSCALWEFRDMFEDIREALSNYSDEWKYLVDTYFKRKCQVVGYCDEGSRSCGRMPVKN